MSDGSVHVGDRAEQRVEARELQQPQDRPRGVDDTQAPAAPDELLVDGDEAAQRRGVTERDERHVDVHVVDAGVDAEPVKPGETSCYADLMSTSGVGSLIRATEPGGYRSVVEPHSRPTVVG